MAKRWRIAAFDPGLGQARPGFGTGAVILEWNRKWSVVASQLIEARTDVSSDDDIAWYTAHAMTEFIAGRECDLGVVEDCEFQGAARAKQTIRLAKLVGTLRHALCLAMGDRSLVVTPARTRILRWLGVWLSDQADRVVKRMVKGSELLRTEHEVSAAAAGIVGFELWRAKQIGMEVHG